jgi:DNA-binding MarR family transcriptional regulator
VTVSGRPSARQRREIAASLDRLVMWARRQAPAQMSSSSITTLDTLRYAGPMRISDLAERERISQPGMTTLVNRLEASGHAERIADPDDGRATLVRISPVGRNVLAERHAERTASLLSYVEQLSPAGQQSLVAALDAMAQLSRETHPAGADTSR